MIRCRLTNDAGDVIDLLSGTIRMAKGWTPKWTVLQQKSVTVPFGYQSTSIGYGGVVETMPVVIQGCAEDIRAATRLLEEFLEGAAAHMDDPLVENAHWWEWQSEGEPPKRALVSGGAWQPQQRPDQAARLRDTKIMATLVFSHHPFAETVSPEANIAEGSVWTIGGQWDINGITGRVPARIWQAIFADDIGLYSGVDDYIQTIWAGFRPENKGLTNFRARWECESTAVGGDSGAVIGYLDADSADAGDITATNSEKCRTTFSDTVLQDRLFIDLYTVNGSAVLDCRHFAGRYLVLCRCKIDNAAKSAHLQMRYGYTGSALLTSCDPVTITNAKWLFHELGTVQIPPIGLVPEGSYSDYDAQCAAFSIVLYSQNVDATWMDIDCLVLVPADYFVKLQHANVEDIAGAANYRTIAAVLPDDRVVAYQDDNNLGGVYRVLSSVSMSPNQWYLPVGDSTLVLAAQEDDESVLDDYMDLTIAHYPRWISYRD